MKTKLFFLALGFAALTLSACSDDDNPTVVTPPEAVLATFQSMQPDNRGTRWEMDGGYYKAEYQQGGQQQESWFAADGTWMRTERDYNGTLPQAVLDYIATNYAGYWVDDVEWVETPAGNYFEIELEANGQPDVTICVAEDGTPVAGVNLGTTLPQAVQQTLASMYPDAIVTDWERDYGYYKAEFRSGGKEYDAWFAEDGTWVRTESDYYGALPQAVLDYIAANYPGYWVDDVEWVETPAGDYFDIELEANGQPDVRLCLTTDGTLATGQTGGATGGTPQAVLDAFAQKYPGATQTEWDMDYGYYKAEYWLGGTEYESWFAADGTWVRTESDLRGALPVAVQSYLATNYAGYQVDDAEWVETPAGSYFELELERDGAPDVHLRLTADGKPVA